MWTRTNAQLADGLVGVRLNFVARARHNTRHNPMAVEQYVTNILRGVETIGRNLIVIFDDFMFNTNQYEITNMSIAR